MSEMRCRCGNMQNDPARDWDCPVHGMSPPPEATAGTQPSTALTGRKIRQGHGHLTAGKDRHKETP